MVEAAQSLPPSTTSPPATDPSSGAASAAASNGTPENAIGPVQVAHVEPGSAISQLLGASTYRIVTDMQRFFPEQGIEEPVAFAVESAVVEAANPDQIAIHVTQSADSPGSDTIEHISVQGKLFARLGDGAWEDVSGSGHLGHGPDPLPLLYSSLHQRSGHIIDGEWVANEDLDGIPVGRYRWSRSEDATAGPHDVVSEGELWVDTFGVIWRIRESVYRNDELLMSMDCRLRDVGADITITPPDVS